MSSHRKTTTARYSPSLSHHCGYSCVLRLANKKGHLRAVRKLREAVASRVVDMYWRGDEVHDMQVRDIVHEKALI